MNKLYINLKRVHSVKLSGVALALFLLFAMIALSYVLFHNPHQDLHKQIFKTADNIRNYYRDQPSYWKLSTETAQNDNLITDELLKHKEFVLKIGQGPNGDVSMPNDSSFDIVLANLSKSACINLSEFSVDKSQQLGLQKITLINDESLTEFDWGGDNPLPIRRYATRNLCQPTGNAVIWTFR